jgi:hypothetical protein
MILIKVTESKIGLCVPENLNKAPPKEPNHSEGN